MNLKQFSQQSSVMRLILDQILQFYCSALTYEVVISYSTLNVSENSFYLERQMRSGDSYITHDIPSVCIGLVEIIYDIWCLQLLQLSTHNGIDLWVYVWSTDAQEIRAHGKTHSKGHGIANLSFPAHTRSIGVTCTHIQEAQLLSNMERIHCQVL